MESKYELIHTYTLTVESDGSVYPLLCNHVKVPSYSNFVFNHCEDLCYPCYCDRTWGKSLHNRFCHCPKAPLHQPHSNTAQICSHSQPTLYCG